MKTLIAAFVIAVVGLFVCFAYAEESPKAKELKEVLEIKEAVAEAPKKELSPAVELKDDGNVIIANRGMIITRKEFKEGCTIRFKWSWESGDAVMYPDHLAIVLRTNGNRKKEWTYGIDEGIVVRLNPHGKGFVEAELWKQGLDGQALGRSKADVPLAEKETHEIEIADAGNVIVVSVGGKEVLRQKVDAKDGSGTHKIAIYNREWVAGHRKVSTLSNLSIQELK